MVKGFVFAAGLAGALALAGCAGSTTASSPPASTAGNRGAELYAARCAACHGTDLRGTAAGPSHLSKVYEPGHHPDAAFKAAIRNGSRAHHWSFGDMPAVPGMSDADIDAVIAYVRAAQAREGFEPYPPS